MKKVLLLASLLITGILGFSQTEIIYNRNAQDASQIATGKLDTGRMTYVGQVPDYTIDIIAGITYATSKSNYGNTLYPAYSGSDAFTVIQAAITQLKDSGLIMLGRGVFNLTDQLVIHGLGSGFHTLAIKGNGWSTILQQNTSGKNALVIDNRAGVDIEDLKIICGSSAKSALLLDSTGANSEVSVNQSQFRNLHLVSANATYPAFYAKNFWFSDFNNIYAVNLSGDAIWMENASHTPTNYGNSTFGKITVDHNTAAGYAGLRIKSGTNTNHGNLDATSINYWYDVNGGDYSIIVSNAFDIHFNHLDIEDFTHPIVLGSGGLTQGCTFSNGAIIVNSGDTCISVVGTTSGGNVFTNIKVIGDATNVPIYDALTANANAPNSYDLWLGQTVSPANNIITWESGTRVISRTKENGTRYELGGKTYFGGSSYDNGAVLNIDASSNIIPFALTGGGKTYAHVIIDPGSGTFGMGLINNTYLALENAQTPGSRDPQLKISTDSTAGAATLWARWSIDPTKSHSLVLRATGDAFLETDKQNNIRIRTNILAATGVVHECIYAYGSDGSVSIGANQNNHYQLEVFGKTRWDSTVTFKKLTSDTLDFVGSAKPVVVDSVGVAHVVSFPASGISDNAYTLGLQAMGSTLKASGLVCDEAARATASFALVSQKASWFAVNLLNAATLTGVETIIKTVGSYTGSNYNGVGLYTVSGGTATLVASSTNSGTLWTAALGLLQVPFSSTYSASPGLYYVCVLYSSSAETTAPNLAAAGSLSLGAYALDFTNGNKLYGIVNSVTSLPSTQALSGITASAAAMWIGVY